ncbi:MAG: hypothetical protein KF715_08515 [Candidatus Didemnitutus sp.]|nr:hypothetical protein [Candidatus Didemnitutus sp.]
MKFSGKLTFITSDGQKIEGDIVGGVLKCDAPRKSVRQLRCLLENDLALVRHYADQLIGEDGVIDATQEDTPERDALKAKFTAAVRKAQARRDELNTLSAPDVGAARNTPAAPQMGHTASQVTRGAAQPDTLV